jgi:hypothetical protein
LERPGAVKGAPLFGAAKRTLDGEDRSKILELEGKDRGNGDGSQFDTNVQNIVVRYKKAQLYRPITEATSPMRLN